MEHHSAVLLRRLNPSCAKALEAATSLCQTRAHAEITPRALAAENAGAGRRRPDGYRPLAQAAMRTIVQIKLNQVSQHLARHYGMKTDISESLYDALTAACLLPDTGARNIC